MLVEVAVDGGLEVDDRAEGATADTAAGQGGEEGLDRVQPGAGGRAEVEDPAGVPVQPSGDFGVLVAAIVVEDAVDELAGGTAASTVLRKRRNS